MSYRLIDANALATSHPEVNDMPCIYADLPNGLDDGYYDMAQGNTGKSRWHELFGTPERAARTIAGKCGDCRECVIANACEYGDGEGCLLSDEGNYDMLLEWLRGESDGE